MRERHLLAFIVFLYYTTMIRSVQLSSMHIGIYHLLLGNTKQLIKYMGFAQASMWLHCALCLNLKGSIQISALSRNSLVNDVNGHSRISVNSSASNSPASHRTSNSDKCASFFVKILTATWLWTNVRRLSPLNCWHYLPLGKQNLARNDGNQNRGDDFTADDNHDCN